MLRHQPRILVSRWISIPSEVTLSPVSPSFFSFLCSGLSTAWSEEVLLLFLDAHDGDRKRGWMTTFTLAVRSVGLGVCVSSSFFFRLLLLVSFHSTLLLMSILSAEEHTRGRSCLLSHPDSFLAPCHAGSRYLILSEHKNHFQDLLLSWKIHDAPKTTQNTFISFTWFDKRREMSTVRCRYNRFTIYPYMLNVVFFSKNPGCV